MKPLAYAALILPLAVGCTPPTITSTAQPAPETSSQTAPVQYVQMQAALRTQSPTKAMAYEMFKTHYAILSEVEPNDLVRLKVEVITHPDGKRVRSDILSQENLSDDLFPDPNLKPRTNLLQSKETSTDHRQIKTRYVFKRAHFGMTRMATVMSHNPIARGHALPSKESTVDRLSNEYQELLAKCNELGLEFSSYFIDHDTLALSGQIENHAAMLGVKGAIGFIPRLRATTPEEGRELAKKRVAEAERKTQLLTSIIKDSKTPTWNGYVGQSNGTELYIFPVLPANDSCYACHALDSPQTPISHLAYLVSRKPPAPQD